MFVYRYLHGIYEDLSPISDINHDREISEACGLHAPYSRVDMDGTDGKYIIKHMENGNRLKRRSTGRCYKRSRNH